MKGLDFWIRIFSPHYFLAYHSSESRHWITTSARHHWEPLIKCTITTFVDQPSCNLKARHTREALLAISLGKNIWLNKLKNPLNFPCINALIFVLIAICSYLDRALFWMLVFRVLSWLMQPCIVIKLANGEHVAFIHFSSFGSGIMDWISSLIMLCMWIMRALVCLKPWNP